MTSNPPVLLEANSLYIATETILSPGFHWSLFITDEAGVATQHQWAEPLPGTPQTGQAESYVHAIVDPPRTFMNNRLMFCYLRIAGFDANRAREHDMVDLMGNTFGEGYATVKENRQAGLTCRTWLLKVLEQLCDLGAIKRENGIKGIEETVKEKSAAAELQSIDNYQGSVVGLI